MYNTRLFYNTSNGAILRVQNMLSGSPADVEHDLSFVAKMNGLSVNEVGFFEWNNPDNELNTILSEGKTVKVDITQNPHVLYGDEPPEPSDDDEISGAEFLNMVEGVM